jgi:hypothetical protein
MLTTKKISVGEFEVYWNGDKTDWRIVNGSLGLSGRDTRNTYVITRGEKIIPIGPLRSCKQILSGILKKKIGPESQPHEKISNPLNN